MFKMSKIKMFEFREKTERKYRDKRSKIDSQVKERK